VIAVAAAEAAWAGIVVSFFRFAPRSTATSGHSAALSHAAIHPQPRANLSVTGLHAAGRILVFPLIGALVNGLFGRRMGKQGVTLMALFAVQCRWWLARRLRAARPGGAALEYEGWSWLTLPLRHDTSAIELKFSLLLDPLSAVMALVVTASVS